ncbi:MAG: hypothetical protein CUN54_10175, partial [Phototrophicales bacterium]
ESIEIEERPGQIVFQITSNDSGTLIGSRGDTIRAINHIARRVFESDDDRDKFFVDVNGYRMNKIKEIEDAAKLLAERARSLKYNVEMNPMSAYERMIVHTVLKDEPHIRTESRGEGRDRRVVICFVN